MAFNLGRLLARTRCGPAGPAVVFIILGSDKGALFIEQGFAVSDRDLIVVGVDFGKGLS